MNLKKLLLLPLVLHGKVLLSAPLTEKIDTYLKNRKNFSGAVLVAQKRNIILSKGYGYANYEHDVPNTPHTKFRIASITKPLVALAIIRLQEQQRISVTDTLLKFFPSYPQADKITIHHLLTHSSGIPNYYKYWSTLN